MNIDLLINKTHDVGLVTTSKLPGIISAVIFDHSDLSLSLEFADSMETIVMNIPVGEDIYNYVAQKQNLFVIGTDKVHIHEAYRTPLMHINMPEAVDNRDAGDDAGYTGGW